MEWGIIMTALTLFGMLALAVASVLMEGTAASQEPDQLMGPACGSRAARPLPVAEPEVHSSASRKAA